MYNTIVRHHQKVAQLVINELTNQVRCVALLGEIYMGKTAVLQLIQDELPTRTIRVSFAELQDSTSSTGLTETTFCSALLYGLPGGASISLDDMLSRTHSWEQLETAFGAAVQQVGMLTILLDDAHYLASYTWGSRAFNQLAAIVNKHENLRIILAGTHRLQQWAEQLSGRRGLWRYVLRPIEINCVSAQMVYEAFPAHPDAAKQIFAWCGGHPYLLQMVTKQVATRREMLTTTVIEAMHQNIQQHLPELATLFAHYWQVEREDIIPQICYLLTTAPIGLPRQELAKRLIDYGQGEEVQGAITMLIKNGLAVDINGRIRLIDLFRDWYENEIGFVREVSLPSKSLPTGALATNTTKLTELIFLLEETLVLVEQERFLFSSDLGSSLRRIKHDFPNKSIKARNNLSNEFQSNLALLSRDLWEAFGKEQWLVAVRQSVEKGYHLRFNIPEEMMEFPFELLPFGEDGRQRIGMEAPISRRLFKFGQGRFVNRLPLQLPLSDERGLRVLVVGAPLDGETIVGKNGRYVSPYDEETSGLVLKPLSLRPEIDQIYHTLFDHPGVEKVTFLTTDHPESGKGQRPTTEAFEKLLQENQFDLIHFTGHGIYLPEHNLQGLAFADRILHLRELKELLARQNHLDFVYLSCCEGGRIDTQQFNNPLSGLAQTCVEAGVPAVLSMRWPIPVGVALKITSAFYPSFLQNGRLDTAVFSAVKMLSRDPDEALSVYAPAPVLLMY